MAGVSFGVMLEERGGSNSSVLKAEIVEVEFALRHRQELFMMVEGAEDGSEEPLSDNFEIESACTVALCVKCGTLARQEAPGHGGWQQVVWVSQCDLADMRDRRDSAMGANVDVVVRDLTIDVSM